jgi:hypothetical protein
MRRTLTIIVQSNCRRRNCDEYGVVLEKKKNSLACCDERVVSSQVVVTNFSICSSERMVHFGGWCRKIISFGNGPDSHSLG